MRTVLCIPTLSEEGAKRTAALVESMRHGTLVPDVVFIVDNGGWVKMHEDDRTVVFRPGKNIGVAPAWNEALRRYEDAVVVLANDDITVQEYSLKRLVDPVENGSTDFAATSGHYFSFFAMSNALVRKIGYFDEGYAPAYFEDTDYLRRMLLNGLAVHPVDTGSKHVEQSTSRDMKWDVIQLMARNSLRYDVKWGGQPEHEKFRFPWNIDFEVCVPSCHGRNLQRLLDSLAWQTVRPTRVTIACNVDLSHLDPRGLKVRQVTFASDAYAIGDGDASLRRNVATWAAQSPYVVYSDDDQVWPQTAMEWFARRFSSTNEFLVVGHHRFIEKMDPHQPLRTARADLGVAREKGPNEVHLWQSCWGGAMGAHAMYIKSMGGWDQGYPVSEDQELARRLLGRGDDGQLTVHEPPWAWHQKDAPHSVPWEEPHKNTCDRGTHSLVRVDDVARCVNCPLVRRAGKSWPTVQHYDPSKVTTREVWL